MVLLPAEGCKFIWWRCVAAATAGQRGIYFSRKLFERAVVGAGIEYNVTFRMFHVLVVGRGLFSGREEGIH